MLRPFCFAFLVIVEAAYVVQDDYKIDTFADQFNFVTGDDPTHGYVNYIDRKTAESSNLYKVNNGKVYIGVDKDNQATGRGRNSIRLESKTRYTLGLFILDLQHIPGSICGSWPAFWTVGSNWPSNGEIDIVEGKLISSIFNINN